MLEHARTICICYSATTGLMDLSFIVSSDNCMLEGLASPRIQLSHPLQQLIGSQICLHSKGQGLQENCESEVVFQEAMMLASCSRLPDGFSDPPAPDNFRASNVKCYGAISNHVSWTLKSLNVELLPAQNPNWQGKHSKCVACSAFGPVWGQQGEGPHLHLIEETWSPLLEMLSTSLCTAENHWKRIDDIDGLQSCDPASSHLKQTILFRCQLSPWQVPAVLAFAHKAKSTGGSWRFHGFRLWATVWTGPILHCDLLCFTTSLAFSLLVRPEVTWGCYLDMSRDQKKGSIVFRLMQKWTNPFPPVNTTIYGPKYVISSFSSPNHDFWVVQMNGWDWWTRIVTQQWQRPLRELGCGRTPRQHGLLELCSRILEKSQRNKSWFPMVPPEPPTPEKNSCQSVILQISNIIQWY